MFDELAEISTSRRIESNAVVGQQSLRHPMRSDGLVEQQTARGKGVSGLQILEPGPDYIRQHILRAQTQRADLVDHVDRKCAPA